MPQLDRSMNLHIPIAELQQHVGQQVQFAGFVDVVRDQKRVQFLIVYDRTGAVQVVHEKLVDSDDPLGATISALTPGSTVRVWGTVVTAPHVKLGGLEIPIDLLEVSSVAEAPLPIASDSSIEKQIDYRQISLRVPEQQLVFRVQTTLEYAMREFWKTRGFIEIHSPKLMGTFSESGSEVFEVKYFDDRKAYLAQSPQFYKQMAMAGGFERVFEIGPVFRAESSFTSRHETEFTSIDMEMAWINSHEDVMSFEEAWLVHALEAVRAEHGPDIKRNFGVEVVIPQTPFPRIALGDARDILRARGHAIEHKLDLDPEGERQICAYVRERFGHEFVWIVEYPASVRAFYHMRFADRPQVTKGFDLLWKGLEVTTGAQREHRYDKLVAQASERGIALEPLQMYLDFFRYGCPPHGGAGIGLGRLLMALLERPTLRDVTLLSRTPTRLTP